MWIVRLVQGMYVNEQSHVRVCEGYSEEFEVKVSVHQDWVLSLLLFIIVLEALPRKFCSGSPGRTFIPVTSVAQLDAPSDWRPGGRGFNPRRGR